jgi:hypothetical protein
MNAEMQALTITTVDPGTDSAGAGEDVGEDVGEAILLFSGSASDTGSVTDALPALTDGFLSFLSAMAGSLTSLSDGFVSSVDSGKIGDLSIHFNLKLLCGLFNRLWF